MATTVSIPNSRLIIAITDDDSAHFEKLNLTPEDLLSYRMEGEMNILNFAIDQERSSIIKFLASVTANKPEFQRKLSSNRFG